LEEIAKEAINPSCYILRLIPAWGESGKNDAVLVELRIQYEIQVTTGQGSSIKKKTRNFKIVFKTATMSFKIDEAWFSKFSFLSQHWPTFREHTLFDVKYSLKSSLGDELSKLTESQTILSIPVQGEHLGIVGSIFIYGLLIYMFLYLREIFAMTKKDLEIPPAPVWVGIMPSIIARFGSFLTLVALPIIGSGMALYRFVFLNISILVVPLLFLPLAYYNYLLAKAVSKALYSHATNGA
jgi:hypothetical protein